MAPLSLDPFPWFPFCLYCHIPWTEYHQGSQRMNHRSHTSLPPRKKPRKPNIEPTDGVANCTIRNLFSGSHFSSGVSTFILLKHDGFGFPSIHHHKHNLAQAIMHRGYTPRTFSLRYPRYHTDPNLHGTRTTRTNERTASSTLCYRDGHQKHALVAK